MELIQVVLGIFSDLFATFGWITEKNTFVYDLLAPIISAFAFVINFFSDLFAVLPVG
ncbi:MAG: hypothetical protein FWH26_00115 [Oscillospiraceae bacterium]|nr:hypothetical protein [Oscillospiraceae bacterium]